MLVFRLLMICTAVVLQNGAHAAPPDPQTGDFLDQSCRAALEAVAGETLDVPAALQGGYCLGLAAGLKGSALLQQVSTGSALFCQPKSGLENKHIAQLIVDYVEANPAARKQREMFVAIKALQEKYPCDS